MNLTQFTNYTFRTLIYVALNNGKPISLKNVADAYGISYNHLKKVAAFLIDEGYLTAQRGRQGGLLLARAPEALNVGEIVRKTERSADLFECFGSNNDCACPLIPVCNLRGLVGNALEAFFAVLDKQTLADLINNHHQLRAHLNLSDKV